MGSLIDEIIRDAMARGDFDALPGEGKKLPQPDDAHTPEDLKLAHKLMKDNDLVPDWIAQGKALEKTHDALRRRITRAGGTIDADLRTAIARYNSEVLSYNLKLPPGIAHRALIRA
jgi:hypothetical protein